MMDKVLESQGGSNIMIAADLNDLNVTGLISEGNNFYTPEYREKVTSKFSANPYTITIAYRTDNVKTVNDKEVSETVPMQIYQFRTSIKENTNVPASIVGEETPKLNTQTEAFKKWFGDSKVVDENGKPLVVYHGTADNIEAFDKKQIGKIFKDDKDGFYFTNNTSYQTYDKGNIYEDMTSAGGYAKNAAYTKNKKIGDYTGANIIPAYISLQNPYIIDSKDIDNGFDGMSSVAWLEAIEGKSRTINIAKNEGHDGIIIIDRSMKFKNGEPEKLIIAFEPNQIKSIFNEGTFDPNNPSIVKEEKAEYGNKKPDLNKAVYPGKQAMVGGSNIGVPEQHKPIVKSQFTSSDLNDPIRLRKIGQNLSSIIGYEVGQEMRTGLVKRFSRRARGMYFPQSGIIRLNNIADINALVHEVGHKFDLEVFHTSDGIAFDGTPEAGVIVRAAGRKDPVLRDKLLDSARRKYGNAYVDSVLEKYELRQELKAMLEKEGYPVNSYPSHQIIPEGIAEFVRNYIMKPNFPTTIAPKFTQLFQNLMSQNDVFDRFIKSAQEQWKGYSEQDPRVITESTIHRDSKEDQYIEKIAEFAGKTYMNILDGLEPYRALQRRFKEEVNANISGDKDPLLQVLSLLGEDGKAEQFMYYAPFKRNGNDVTLINNVKPLFQILEPILKEGKLKEYEGYLVALRNLELYDNKISAAATTSLEVAKETVKLYEQQLGKTNLEQFQKDIWEYQKALLDYYYAAGKLTAEAYQQSLELHKYYVPFKRYFGEHESTGQAPAVSKYVKDYSPSPVKKIKGSSREVVSPLGSIIENTYDLLAAADRNIALKNIVEAMKLIDPRLVQEIPKTSIIGKMGVDGEVKWVWDNKKPENEHIISVFENGKVKYFQIPKEFYDSFFSITNNYDKAIRLLSMPSRLLQAGAVQFDPTFAVRNVPRDQMSALFYSKYGYNPFHFVKGIAAFAKKDEMYQKFLASGADQSFLTAMDQQLNQNYIDKKAGKTIGTRTQEYVRNPLKVFQDINRLSELGTRLGAFRNAYLKTGDIYLAMQEGRDIAADYGIKGLAMKNISPLYPFLNARMQHMRMTTSAIKNNPLGSLAKGFMYVTVPALLNWVLNNYDDDDRKLYEQLPSWRKLAFFNIRIPGTNSFLPIPKGFWGVLFGSTAEYAMDKLYEKEKGDITDIMVALKNEYAPLGATISDIFPQFLRPVAEQWANEIAFTGAPIVPESYEGLPSELQYNDYTSHVAVVLGGLTNISPMRIDAFVKGYGAGFSNYPIAFTDELLEAVGIAEEDPDEKFKVLGVNLQKMPLVKAFIPFEASGTKSESVGEFYDVLDRLENMNKTVNKLISTSNESKMLDMFSDESTKEDYKFYLQNQTAINKFKTVLRVARQLKIYAMKESSGKGYIQNVDKINYMVVRTAQEFQKAYNDKSIFGIDPYLMDLYNMFQEGKKTDREKKEQLKDELGIEKKKGGREISRETSRENEREVSR
ncbi:MAG: LPD38 domain-containing protein [Candidatus Pacearchaeota archaeon]